MERNLQNHFPISPVRERRFDIRQDDFSRLRRLFSNGVSASKSLVSFLSKSGYSKKFRILPLAGGANNRVFRLDCDGVSFLLKHYFYHPQDPLDRLQTEFSFLSFAWENSVRALPQPLACDAKNHFGIYEFIQGSKVQPGEVSEEEVNQVLTLFFEINSLKNEKRAQELGPEKEACFTLSQHLKCIERRISLLKKIQVLDSSGIGSNRLLQKVSALIWQKIVPAWNAISQRILKESARLDLEFEKEIHPADQCLSHSDIGFHNAIRLPDRSLRFVDFEYAGWGDPAKMVCDFFCAPKVPVPIKYFQHFSESVAQGLKEPEKFLKRVKLLLPLYKLKWCCILMNDFLPVGQSRRHFALAKVDPHADKAGRKAQLHKVEEAIEKLSRELTAGF